MTVSKVSFDNNSNKQTLRTNITKSATIPVAAAALCGAVYGGVDFFSGRKNFQKAKKLITDEFNKIVEDDVAKTVQKRLGWNEKVTDEDITYLREYKQLQYSRNFSEKINNLKNQRCKSLKKGYTISCLAGAGVGMIISLYKILENMRKNNSSKETQNSQTFQHADVKSSAAQNAQNPEINPSLPQNRTQFNRIIYNKNLPEVYKQVPFKGMIEDKLTSRIYDIDYLNDQLSKDYTPEEIELAKVISDVTVDNWPNGVSKKNLELYKKGILFDNDKFTDRDYQMLLIHQLDDKYKHYNFTLKVPISKKTKKYIKSLPMKNFFEIDEVRLQNLVDQLRLNKYRIKKRKIIDDALHEIKMSCIKNKIEDEFISCVNSGIVDVNLPNSIMIYSKDKKRSKDLISWIIAQTNCNYLIMEDKNDSNQVRYNQITSALEKAKLNFDRTNKPTLLYVENFSNLLKNSSDGNNVVADLKDLLSHTSQLYNTTILFECDNTKELDPIAIQRHRVQKYDLEKEVSPLEFRKAQIDFVKANLKKNDDDGYKYKYSLFEEKYVDLYLGNYGYTNDILWIDSNKAEAVKSVIDNFDIIKMCPYFANIKKVQCPEPDDKSFFEFYPMNMTNYYTMDFKPIYEYDVE